MSEIFSIDLRLRLVRASASVSEEANVGNVSRLKALFSSSARVKGLGMIFVRTSLR